MTPEERVLSYIEAPDPGGFDVLALEIFHHQVARNDAYRRWCEATGSVPGRVARREDIPAVPVAAFKELEFCCGIPAAEFRTSGTTGAGRGRHLLPSLAPYRAAALGWFARCVLVEGWPLRTLVLAPPPALRPHSSLSRMLAWIVEERGEPGSGWFVGAGGLEAERLAGALLDARRGSGPVLIAATTAALLAFLDYCDATSLRLDLPGGSRLVDTGGQKGTRRPVPEPPAAFQAAVYARVAAILGIPPERCLNEYGMTELCSQAYDDCLVHPVPNAPGPRIKVVPPWVRVTVVDPVTLAPSAPGAIGLLQFLDLANVGSVCAVLTEDLGWAEGDGFGLAGRPRDAESRGCGLTFAELLSRGAAT